MDTQHNVAIIVDFFITSWLRQHFAITLLARVNGTLASNSSTSNIQQFCNGKQKTWRKSLNYCVEHTIRSDGHPENHLQFRTLPRSSHRPLILAPDEKHSFANLLHPDGHCTKILRISTSFPSLIRVSNSFLLLCISSCLLKLNPLHLTAILNLL